MCIFIYVLIFFVCCALRNIYFGFKIHFWVHLLLAPWCSLMSISPFCSISLFIHSNWLFCIWPVEFRCYSNFNLFNSQFQRKNEFSETVTAVLSHSHNLCAQIPKINLRFGVNKKKEQNVGFEFTPNVIRVCRQRDFCEVWSNLRLFYDACLWSPWFISSWKLSSMPTKQI